MPTHSIHSEMLEQYGEAFARALGVFVQEIARGQRPAVAIPAADDRDEALHERLHARSSENDQLAKRGQLQPIPFDGDALRQTFSDRIRAVLRKRSMSQKQLAQSLGITPANISRILKRPEKSQVDTLERIAAALGVKLADLF